jgi:hypothetical protein
MSCEDGGFIEQLYEHSITGRISFIQWMFSMEGLGEQWGSRAEGQQGGGHRWEEAMPLHYGHTANEGPVKIQYKCLVPIYVFPEMKLLFPKQNYIVLSPVPTLIYL